MIKHLFSTLTLGLALTLAATPTLRAQDKVKSDDEKTKIKEGDATLKTKMDEDGKEKVKSKSGGKAKMKATTKPRKGEGQAMGQGTGVMVGGAMMTPDKDIVVNASASADHTTLVTAVKAADLVGTLQGAGPFTVFAPTNAAFDKLPAGTVTTLTQPENKGKLSTILTYHVVPGRYLAADLKDGQQLTTVEGEMLTVHRNGDMVMIHDAKGGMANVTTADVVSSNGVTHVVDTVLMPTR